MIKISVYQRITLLSVAIVITIILIFGTGSLLFVGTKLTEELTNRLHSEAVDISRSLSFLDGNIMITEQIEWEEEHHKEDEGLPIYIIIVDPDLHEFRRSSNCIDKPIEVASLPFFRFSDGSATIPLEGKNWRFVTSPMNFHGESYGWIIVGMSFERINHIQAVMLRIYLVGLPFMIVLALLGSAVLARRALAPIHLISKKARAIQAVNLNERLPEPTTKDEIAHLSQTLNGMLDRIQKSIVTIRGFSANASHELKTPLSVINSRIEQLKLNISDVDQEVISDIGGEIKRMSRIIDNLSTLAKADSDTIKLEKNRVWMNDVVYEELSRFNKIARGKNIVFNTSNLQSIEITGDEYWLRIMLSNLIDNALKFVPPESTIDVGIIKNGRDEVEMWVADEGPGVADADLENLSKRFFRSKSSPTVPGSGLGLSIVQWVANAHHWKLEFLNREKGGLKALLTIPRA